jgi:hypothetical protein
MQLVPAESGNSKKDHLRGQIRALRSGNRVTILDTLQEIRAESSTSILPELFNLLLEQEDEEILREISSLLNDLKIQEAAQILAEAIENPEYQPIITILLAACWQNGLSYGKYADTFARVAIRAEFAAAIEAFTVLEEAVGELEKEDRERLSVMIKHGLSEADEQKKLLLRELVKVIETY